MKKGIAIVVEQCQRTGLYAGHALGFPSVYATGVTTEEELIRNLQEAVAQAGPRRMKARQNFPGKEKIETGLREMGQLEESREHDADFIVTPKGEEKPFKVQMWGSMVFSENNRGTRDIRIAICVDEEVFCYPHDEMLEAADQKGVICNSPSWQLMGHYTVSTKRCTKPPWSELLAPHRIYPRKP